MRSNRCGVVVRAGVLAAVFVTVGCPEAPPTTDVLTLSGALSGPGGDVDVDFSDAASRGEWWPCEARLTATACVSEGGGQHHVNVFIARPEIDDIASLGGTGCVVDGAAQGAFEILRAAFGSASGEAVIGEDVNVFVLVGSDVDGDGSADLDDDGETFAVAKLSGGTVGLVSLQDFTDPLSLRIDGAAEGVDGDVTVVFLGPMTNPQVIAPLEPPTTCVAPE
jgi:hypothetical protein